MPRRPRPSSPETSFTSSAAPLIHEFLDMGLPRDVLAARSEVIEWLDAWLRLIPQASADPGDALSQLFRDPRHGHGRAALQPYVLRLFVRWLALRGDLSPDTADRLTLGLAPYCDARRFFPGGPPGAERESSAPETPLSCLSCPTSRVSPR